MSEFKSVVIDGIEYIQKDDSNFWTSGLVMEFAKYCLEDNAGILTPTGISKNLDYFIRHYPNTHTVKEDESNCVFNVNKINKRLDQLKYESNVVDGRSSNWVLFKSKDAIERKSDGFVLKVGDYINYEFAHEIFQGTINYFTYCNGIIDVYFKEDLSKCYNIEWLDYIHHLPKQKPILFTTSDGKPIYHGDKFYTVTDDFKVVWSDAVNGMHLTPGIISRSFSTEESANTYVLENKSCLSLNDCLPVIKSMCDGTYNDINRWNFLDQTGHPKELLDKLKELIKSKINK